MPLWGESQREDYTVMRTGARFMWGFFLSRSLPWLQIDPSDTLGSNKATVNILQALVLSEGIKFSIMFRSYRMLAGHWSDH